MFIYIQKEFSVEKMNALIVENELMLSNINKMKDVINDIWADLVRFGLSRFDLMWFGLSWFDLV